MGRNVMSEDHNANETEDERNTKSVNRRSFVKSLGVAGGTAAFGVTAVDKVSGKKSSSSNSDIDVIDTDILEKSAPTDNVESVMSSDYNQSIKNQFIEELDLYPNPSNAVEASIKTTDERWNNHDPVIVMVPFTPNDQEQGRGGILNSLVVEHQGELLPVASFAVSAMPPTSKNKLSIQSSESHVVTAYGTDKQGNVIKVDEGTQSITNGISTQATLGCATCSTIVGYLCAGGAGSLTVSACFGACLPAVSTGPGYILCSAACGAIVRGVAAIGCGYTGTYVCGELGYC